MGQSKNKDEAAPQPTRPRSPGARETLYTLENKEGEVVALDKSKFGIRPSDGQAILFPVNLPKELQKGGIKVKFTAHVKENRLTELWVGQPILISYVEKI